MAKWFAIVVAMAIGLAACGGGERDQGIADLMDLGFPQEEAECIVDGIREEIGSLSRLDDEDVTEDEVSRAAAVFQTCAPGSAGRVDDPGDSATGNPGGDAGEDPSGAQTTTTGGDSGTGAAMSGGPGHWTAAQLCELIPEGGLDSLFGTTEPIAAKEGTDQPEWSVCNWEDPDVAFDPLVATPKLFTIKNIPRDVQSPPADQENVDLGLSSPDGAVFYDELDPSMSAIVVFAGDQLLQVSFPMGTPGAREVAAAVAGSWAEAQTGTTPSDEGAEGDGDPSPTETASAEAPGTAPDLDPYWNGCAAGDPDACDRLFLWAPIGSPYEDFGLTCGNRQATNCTALLGDENGSFTPDTPPPAGDPELVSLWQECGAGDPDACNKLYFAAPAHSDFEYYGQSCGGRAISFDCVADIANYQG